MQCKGIIRLPGKFIIKKIGSISQEHSNTIHDDYKDEFENDFITDETPEKKYVSHIGVSFSTVADLSGDTPTEEYRLPVQYRQRNESGIYVGAIIDYSIPFSDTPIKNLSVWLRGTATIGTGLLYAQTNISSNEYIHNLESPIQSISYQFILEYL